MLRPHSGVAAIAYFDDVAFAETSPPPPTPAPTPTATLPPGATEAPTATSPTPTPAAEPRLFPALTNGSFEDVREDGTPYAWRKIGGEMAATDTAHVDGDLALQLVSRTSSTKWAYQVVTVEAGRTYDFAGFSAAGPGTDEAFLRVSWYSSTDGAGSMIASVDSPSTSSATAAFQHLSTGAIAAPAEAHSAKLRLMLRPTSAALAVSYFDSLSFGETTTAPAGSGPAAAGSASVAVSGSTSERGPDFPPPLVLGAAGVPLVGFAMIASIELSRRRRSTT
jgi:hypothetical protein